MYCQEHLSKILLFYVMYKNDRSGDEKVQDLGSKHQIRCPSDRILLVPYSTNRDSTACTAHLGLSLVSLPDSSPPAPCPILIPSPGPTARGGARSVSTSDIEPKTSTCPGFLKNKQNKRSRQCPTPHPPVL